MDSPSTLTRVLAWVGTILVWFPLAAMLLTSAFVSVRGGRFRLDYLMPAELFPVVVVGAGLLLWAALRGHSHAGAIAWPAAVAAGSLILGQVLAVVTGLASGATPPTGVAWVLVLTTLVVYLGAVVALGVSGAALIAESMRRN